MLKEMAFTCASQGCSTHGGPWNTFLKPSGWWRSRQSPQTWEVLSSALCLSPAFLEPVFGAELGSVVCTW